MSEFTSGEKATALWDKIMTRIEDRIRASHLELEGNLDLDATNRVRGKIRELRAWQKLNSEDPIVP